MAEENSIDQRSDTFDVLSYSIDASLLNYKVSKHLDAQTTLKVVKKLPSSTISVDLKGLATTAVWVNDVSASFTHVGEVLRVKIPEIFNSIDTIDVRVAYNGTPQSDPQWGGFYFSGDYAYNLGVGFASDPHNFGRVWFPCFDNFTDRSEYYTSVTVDSGIRAYANGYLNETVNNGDNTVTFKWIMDEPIPTYLASVAVAPYESVEYIVDDIPVVLAAMAADTANARSSFENLATCIREFEKRYGDHSFDKIGFTMVPFNAGAMEHATNIAYPIYAISGGTKNSETLFAHELAHHWWGNTITCSAQEEMWLNEGWASYSEALFTEAVYGKKAYEDYVQDNHRSVLQFAHVRDGAVLPVSGIGHANTYGSHVYNKGADMVHSLRGMMGDDDFFAACTSFQQTFKFKDVSTDDMKLHFQSFTSIDLTGFFDMWIKEAGFAHPYMYDWAIEGGTEYRITLRQNSRFNGLNYTNIPVPVTALDAEYNRFDTVLVLNDSEGYFKIDAGFDVEAIIVDFDNLLSDASTNENMTFTSDSMIAKGHALMEVAASGVGEKPVNVRVEHHWVSPDHSFNVIPNLALSRQRYWVVDGVIPEGVQLSAQIKYSGLTTTTNADLGYLDNELIRISEDSLVLMYRPNAKSNWELATDYSKNMGSVFNKFGDIEISDLKKGQYTFAMYDAGLASGEEIKTVQNTFKLSPNPVNDILNITLNKKHDCCTLEITNYYGQLVKSQKFKGKKSKQTIDVSDLVPGTYFVGIITEGKAYDVKKLVVRR